jgi:DNA-binding LacI/PurR family transcriptional regulator
MRDVAQASGVSATTVSFVLNGVTDQRISPATRDRVMQAARELGYVPHGVAKALREGSSRIVLLGLPPGARGGGSLVGYLRGLDEELARHGHMLLVRRSAGESLAPVVAAVSPRGVIDLSGLYQSEPATDGGWVNGLAAHTMVQLRHLADTGHRSVAMALPDDPGWVRLREARVRYAREAATRLGFGRLTTVTIPDDLAGTVAAVRALRDASPTVTAVAAFDDRVALRLLAALRELDVTVPDGLAVIGFDDLGDGAFTVPALTSVRIDAESSGRRAARIALDLDTADVAPSAADVVVRESA